MSTRGIPMPPLKLRRLVGPTDPQAFDNPSGNEVFAQFAIAPSAYDFVFDFGCGCGRLARQLLQQTPRPRRYVGIDVHKEMIKWCQHHLTPLEPGFQFQHHDVYAPSYAPRNTLRLAQSLPVEDGECTLFVASSVFTHLFQRQTKYYLRELARILSTDGAAYTTWFFFDRDSFPFLTEGPYCLFAGETDPTQAVIYDRRWFLDTVQRLGLYVKSTTPPRVPGHQWVVVLAHRERDVVDKFPLGADEAEWLCGATFKPIARPALTSEDIQRGKVAGLDSEPGPQWPEPPALFGAMSELAAARQMFMIRSYWRVRYLWQRLRHR